jgi:hypothetical protein
MDQEEPFLKPLYEELENAGSGKSSRWMDHS